MAVWNHPYKVRSVLFSERYAEFTQTCRGVDAGLRVRAQIDDAVQQCLAATADRAVLTGDRAGQACAGGQVERNITGEAADRVGNFHFLIAGCLDLTGTRNIAG